MTFDSFVMDFEFPVIVEPTQIDIIEVIQMPVSIATCVSQLVLLD